MTISTKKPKKSNGCKCPNCDTTRSTNYVDYLPKNHVGRPTKYDPKTSIFKAIQLLKEGKALVQVATEFRICRDTLYEWMNNHPEFSDAIRAGLTFSEAWWIQEGQQNLGTPKYNHNMWSFNMKNRFGWYEDKPSQGKQAIKGYKGSLRDKLIAIGKHLEEGNTSIDQHIGLMEGLVKESKTLETITLQEQIDKINEKLGLKK